MFEGFIIIKNSKNMYHIIYLSYFVHNSLKYFLKCLLRKFIADISKATYFLEIWKLTVQLKFMLKKLLGFVANNVPFER